MADPRPPLSTEERVRRSVGRTLANLAFAAILGVGLAAFAATGVYQLEPGEAAVVLRFGAYRYTAAEPGLRLHWPRPFETHVTVPVATVKQVEFGYRGPGTASPEDLLQATIQTRDNNIVHLGFVVQYRVKDAFQSRYRVEDPAAILRDAAQAAIREVVGRTSIDEVLAQARGPVQAEAEEILQNILDRYESGLAVEAFQLQEVQPPEPVRGAFDDVLAALQDKDRAKNEAQGVANEVVPKARAEATELREGAKAYREVKIADATGQAARFQALAAEYRKAPEVTRQRLYLETMEAILPAVEKVIIEPGTTSVLPHLPLGRDRSAPQ